MLLFMNFSAVPHASVVGKFLRLPLKCLPTDMVLPVVQGPLRGMKWISGSSNHGCWLGSYEYRKQRLFDSMVDAASIVWDIGANVGFYTLLASRRAARVIAVEPLPENLRYLEKHVRLNGITNVEVLPAAAGHECGRQSFCLGENSSTGHLGAGTYEVNVITLDSIYEKFGAPHVIKIDVEGAEYSALLSMERCLATYPVIFLATHSPMLAEKCSRVLTSAGYVHTALAEDEFVFSHPAASVS
jgi:FkbM family methyltransferase